MKKNFQQNYLSYSLSIFKILTFLGSIEGSEDSQAFLLCQKSFQIESSNSHENGNKTELSICSIEFQILTPRFMYSCYFIIIIIIIIAGGISGNNITHNIIS